RAAFDVLPDSQRLKQLHLLECPAEPAARARRWPVSGDVHAADANPSASRLEQPCASVEGRRLAGSVGADQAGYPPGGSVQADAVDRDQPSEAHLQVLDL